MKANARPKYSLEMDNVKEFADEGPWRSYDLVSEGDTLEELLDNAIYWQTDQDGGSLGDVPADDNVAQDLITEWFNQHGPKHTAAPWSIWKSCITNDKKELIARVTEPKDLSVVCASPDMLEACQLAFHRLFELGELSESHVMNVLREAIAKAHGKIQPPPTERDKLLEQIKKKYPKLFKRQAE